MDVQDARTEEQKAQSDANIRREMNTADTMEKNRLKKEAQLQREHAKAAASARKKRLAPAARQPEAAVEATRPKGHAKLKKSQKKKKPEFFTARGAAPEKPKHAASKPK